MAAGVRIMQHFRNFVILVFLSSLILHIPPSDAVSKCTYTVAETVYKISNWTWEVRSGVNKYEINLCGPLKYNGKCKNAAVCKTSGEMQNFGNFSGKKTEQAADKTGFNIVFSGTKGKCAHSASSNVVSRSKVILICGKTLGSPEVTETITGDNSCETVFEFITNEACKNSAQNTVREFPCYVYQENSDKKIDLSPLIKLTGSHEVASESKDYDLHINVCREITPDKNLTTSHIRGCPKGASSCRVLKNGKKENMGQLSFNLTINLFNHKQIILHYVASKSGTSCVEPPSTTIVFECPELFHQASGKGPRVTADSNCHYEVLWMTEYACPEAVLKTNGCVIKNEFVQFDLTPLKAVSVEDNYKVTAPNANAKGKIYLYYINVCDSTHIACPVATNVSVCQEVPNTKKEIYNLGVTQELRYADGELTMVFTQGDRCHHSGFKRSTIIYFKCEPTIDKGRPEFREEDECLYLFDWKTKYACPPSRRTGTNCQVSSTKGVRYDLSELVRMDNMNWLAIDGQQSSSDNEIYVSVCGELMNVTGKTDKCDTTNAICIVNTKTKVVKNLGKYKQPLTLNSDGSMLLSYTEGDVCKTLGNKKIRISSVITFVCHPGDLASPPVLVSSSLDKCTYQFMWRTAAACSLGVNLGEKCRVEDKKAGYVFDLNPLSKARNWGKHFYKIPTVHGFFFQLTVCRGSSKCVAGQKNVSACQVKNDNTSHLVVSQANDNLYYYDGMINLTYSGGQRCLNNSKLITKTHITFLCNASSEINDLPEYEFTDNCTHNFKWPTKYACPAKVVECAVRSGEQQYDLSNLVKTADNWYTPARGGTAYINICRTLNRNPYVRRCKGTPAVCLVPKDSSKDGINLGQVSSAPIMLSSTKEIMLNYTNGDICDEKKGTRYRTEIHFSCKRGSADSSPEFKGVSECVYKFHWAVAAACAIENAEGDNCMVKDPASDTTYNLMPLSTQFPNQDFIVNGTGDTRYHLRICGPLTQTCASDPSAAACEVRKNGEKISLGVSSKKLLFQGEVIQLTYVNGARDPVTGRGREVTIRFYCNPTVPLGSPKFVQQEKYQYVFDFQTSLACSAKAVQCSVTDNKGTKYDLTPLGLSSGNWEAVDTRSSQRHLHYFINVCRSVNTLPGGLTCAGGGIGGCQIDHKLNRGHNMGNVQSNPQVVGDGLLTLRYFGGEGCHNNKYHRSTRITFSCDKTMGSPIFVEESTDCEYLFKWKTPFACPVKSSTGSHCTVEVPQYGYTFNLSSLNKGQNNYTVLTSDNQKLILNVCGKVSTKDPKCSNPANASACLEGKKVLGIASENLTYNGDITLRYSTTSPKCSVEIVFQCDTGQHGAGTGPEVVTQIDNKTMCYYRLTWNTDLACIPLSHTQCSFRAEVSDGGSTYDLQYDLTSLSRKTGNWKAVNSADDTRSVVYFINVCSSVNNKGEAKNCNRAAGVCKVEIVKGKKRYWSLGVQRGSPKKVGKVIFLSYEDGDADPRCTGNNVKATTRIQLSCSKTEGNPVYVTFYRYQCRYEFMWQTPAACPLNEHSGTEFNNCTALNLQQNYLFDLNPLHRAADYKVMDKNQHYYFLNVCGPLSKANQNKCNSKTTGICQLRVNSTAFHKNAGNYNKRLTFQDGVLALVYDGGEYCKHSNTNRTTVISFVCNAKAGSSRDRGTPVFVTESNDCTYYIDWHTSLACEKQIECLAIDKNGVTYDLSALKKDDGNWPVVPEDPVGKPTAMYYINICRGLVPMPGIQCPAGSSACLVKTTGSGPVSMGRLDNEPTFSDGNELILQYTWGGPCPENSKKNISTKIIFRCVEGTLGKPMLSFYSSCNYTITWETSAACGHKQTADTKRCTVYDNATSHLYDLKPLTTRTDFKNLEAFSPNNVKFLFNLCNGTSKQPGHGVCRVMNETYCVGYGLLAKSSLYYSHGERFLRLKYCDPNCDKYKKMAIIDFMCNINAIPGSPKNQPVVASYSDYQVVITWNTSLACPPVQKSCIHSSGGFTYDLRLLSSQTRSWHYKTVDGQEFWINICRGINDGPKGCPSSASVCRQKDGKIDVLGLTSTQRMTTSDNLLLMYSGQSLVKDCQSTLVVFQFTCGSHIGRPQLQSSIESSCTFHFHWKTKAACKIERTKLPETDCKVNHPATNQLVDFSQLNNRNWKVQSMDNIFYISICGNIHSHNLQPGEALPTECQQKSDNAVVCIKPVKVGDHPNAFKLKSTKSRAFYYEDFVFSLWLETEALTPGETSCRNANFTINFYCSKGTGKGKPAFLYRSLNCHYVFDWETSLVCIGDQSGNIVDVAAKKGALSSAGSKVGVAFAVLLIIAIVIAAVIVLRKTERREYILFYIRTRYRRLFMKKDFKSPKYRYTKVNTSDDEEADLLLNVDDEEQQQFVDESDDEDILHL